MFLSQRDHHRLLAAAVFLFTFFQHVNGLAMKYCSSLNTASTNASKFWGNWCCGYETSINVRSLQTLPYTNRMDYATISASTAMHLQSCKEVIVGVRTTYPDLRPRLMTAQIHVLVIPLILVVETIHTVTYH